MKTTAERINNQWVMTRTKDGAPRKFQAGVGEVKRLYVCMCPRRGGKQCSHETALYTLLHQEAAATEAQPAYVVA